jgi:HMG-box domain
VPKYKGRKRGRKPKKRKRVLNPNRQKRQHTAYTLFVQEVYPGIRAQYQDFQSKDIIGLVARQWASIPEVEKQVWKERAMASHEQVDVDDEDDDDDDDDIDEDDVPHDEEGDGEDDEEVPKRKRGRPRKKV